MRSNKHLSLADSYAFKSPEQVIKVLLQCSLFYLTDKDNASEFIDKSKSKLANSEQISSEQFNELNLIVWQILEKYLRSPKDEKSHQHFIRQIVSISKDPPVSEEFATNLLENLQSERQLLELKFHDKTTTRVSLAKFNFRIDVSIRDEESSIKPIPILILDLTLSNGKRITFRCPMAQFHQLRFTAARLLKEIQFLGTRQIITR